MLEGFKSVINLAALLDFGLLLEGEEPAGAHAH